MLKEKERERKKEMLYCSLNASLEVAPRNRFFFFGFTEKKCTMGCVFLLSFRVLCVRALLLLQRMYLQTKLLDVCFLLLFAALYTYSLNC